MRVEMKGLHSTYKVLANGEKRVYWYAWRGGPRLSGKPGEPEFMASHAEAVASARPKHGETLQAILNAYQKSVEFTDLAPRTQSDYVKQARKIETEFGELPVAALADKRLREDIRAWHAKLAPTSRRQADYARTVLALILGWAVDHGRAPANPAAGLGRRQKRQTRRDKIWSEAQETSFMQTAPAHLRLALQLALWSGQRQGDLLRLTWAAFDGHAIRLTQSKTGAHVTVPLPDRLCALLDRTREATAIRAKRDPESPAAVQMLATAAGRPWTESGFRASWRTACKDAGVAGVTFHDLRGTAVVRLARAGNTIAQIASVTGHSLGDATAILDSHYLARDPQLAESAMRARVEHEARTDSTN